MILVYKTNQDAPITVIAVLGPMCNEDDIREIAEAWGDQSGNCLERYYWVHLEI